MTPPATLSDSSKRWLAAGVTLLILALLLGMAEGAIRLRQWIKYGSLSTFDDLFTTDEKLGLRVLVPGSRTATISINSRGFRGPEIPMPKPPGTVRLAFIGASTTYCAEVSGEAATWPHLVAKAVAAAYPAVKIDYVNAGVPGYAMKAIRKNLQVKVAPLEPDVIVFYEAANQLSYDLGQLAIAQGFPDRTAQIQPSWLGQHSMLWGLVEKNLRIMSSQRGVTTQNHLQFDPGNIGGEYRNELTGFVQDSKKLAKVVAVATFSHQYRSEQSPEQKVKAAASSLYYMPFMTPDGLIGAFAAYNAIALQVARAEGVIAIGGENDIPGDPQHFTDSVHFSDAGSRSMAERVSKALLAAPAFRALLEQHSGQR